MYLRTRGWRLCWSPWKRSLYLVMWPLSKKPDGRDCWWTRENPLPVLPADHCRAHSTGSGRPRFSPSGGASAVLPHTSRPRCRINQIGCNQRQFAAFAQDGGNQCTAQLAQRHKWPRWNNCYRIRYNHKYDECRRSRPRVQARESFVGCHTEVFCMAW